jgi:hypothetical protein
MCVFARQALWYGMQCSCVLGDLYYLLASCFCCLACCCMVMVVLTSANVCCSLCHCEQIKAVNPDHSVVFKQYGGQQTYTVPFSAKRAADLHPGMVMIVTLVTLSNGDMFATDWG